MSKVHYRLVSLFAMVLVSVFMVKDILNSRAQAATDTVDAELAVNAGIAIICAPDTVTMSPIDETGQSTVDASNKTECNVNTNNSGGYLLKWRTTTVATMNSGGDTIAAYIPVIADTPEAWSVAPDASAWGGHVGKDSTFPDTSVWGTTDDYAATAKWLNIATTDRTIVTATDESLPAGDNEIIYFGAEIGANKQQPSGTYTVNVTITAVTP